jgi:integrase/DNA-directed RNA polymerase subunit RPC12/RpoP
LLTGGQVDLGSVDLGRSQDDFSSQQFEKDQSPKQSTDTSLVCPQCGCNRLFKAGLRYLFDGVTAQRWLCRECNYRFSVKPEGYVSLRDLEKQLKASNVYGVDCQDHDETHGGGVYNILAEGYDLVNSDIPQEAQREGTQEPASTNDVSDKILQYLKSMKQNGAKDCTIRTWNMMLRKLARHTDMTSDSVKDYLAKTTDWTIATKKTVVIIYNGYLKFHGVTWTPPKYRPADKLHFIPTEAELDAIITGSSRTLSVFLQLVKETAVRGGEASQIKWSDIDFERKIVHINSPEKGSRARILPISNKLVDMLNRLPRKTDTVFVHFKYIRVNYHRTRKNLVFKLQNPRLKGIHIHTFRHWKATHEYHKTKDIIHVQQMLGHRSIECTMIYITLEAAVYQTTSEDYTIKIAKDLDEACKLLEVGFEYVTDMEGAKLFRKRK